MESNFTFIKDVLPEAYNIAYGLEQNIIRDIPSSGEDFGQFLELIVNDMLEKKLRKITDKYVQFSERVSKLFKNDPRIISDSFKDKLKSAYSKRSKCVHVDPETNLTFKPPTSFYVKFVKDIFYIAVLYYRTVEDEFFVAPKYIPPYKLDRLKYEDLNEEAQHQFDLFLKYMQEGRNPSEVMEELFSKTEEISETDISEESKIIETEGLKESIEVSDVECGIIADGSDKGTNFEPNPPLEDFSKFLKAIKISQKEKILTKCLVCGNETDDSNVCSDCLKKIYFLNTLQIIYRSFKNDSFEKNDLLSLGFTERDAIELMSILKDYVLIKESSSKFIFNKTVVENFFYLEKVVDIEDLFVSFYNENLSSKNISESEFYHLGKEGNTIFNRFYIIVSNIKFNRYIKDLTENIDPDEAEELNSVSIDEIVDWYDERINRFIQTKENPSEENSNFIQKFILITEVLMNKWLNCRGKNLTRKEINVHLGLSNEITNFWFKKAEQYGFNEEYGIFDTFARKREIIDMDLIIKYISDDKTREEIANDAHVKISELNKYYELGMRKIEPYVSFYEKFKNNYVYKRIGLYIENLKDNCKSSEAQLKTKISSEELQDWYNQGKIDFITADASTERFKNFFFFRTIILSNRWLNLRKESYSFEGASQEIEVSAEEVQEWLDFGNNKQYENLDGYQLFKNFFITEEEIVIDSIIESLDEGKSLKEAALKEELSVEDLDKYYELGYEPSDEELDDLDNTFYDESGDIYTLESSDSDKYPYNKYSEYIENVYFPKRRYVYLRLLSDGQSKENAAKLCDLDINDIDDWYAQGKQGKNKYVDFYNEYLKIKIEIYKNYLAKGKFKKEALKASDLEDDELLGYEDDINRDLLKKRMDLVLREIESGKGSAKIAKKLKIKQSDIFKWVEKGFNGESEYVGFYKEYYENYICIGCEMVSSYFAKGLNKNKTVKQMRKDGYDIDIEDINHWQSIDLLMDEKDYKGKVIEVENIEDGIKVDEVGEIKELDKSDLRLSINNICKFNDDLSLFVNKYESKTELDEDSDDILIIDYSNKIIEERYDEIDYSKRLQSAYLDILSYENFNDYENIWHWVLKKANEPDFNITSIFKEETIDDKDLSIGDVDIESEEDSSFIEYHDDSSYVSDPIGLLDDYKELKDDEEREKDYALVSQFIEELGRENEMFGEFDEDEEFIEIKESENLESSSSVEEDISVTLMDESLNQKVKSLFEDKIINKELTKSIKEEYNLPNYVIEFLIDKFSQNGVDYESIVKVLKYSFRPNIPKPESFEVVDKVSVSLFYKANRYIAKFSNLNYGLEIDPSYPFQYEKLLSGNVWAYVKLKNGGTMDIDDLELIEGPYFSIDEITDNRKEFTKEEWIDLLVSSCGINPKALTYETKFLLLLRLTPFVEKNFNLCEISDGHSLKDMFYYDITFNNNQVNETLYGLFYNQQKHKKGAISYFDSISIKQFANLTDINKKDSLLDYMIKWDEFNKDSYNDTSLIFESDINEHLIDFIKGFNKSSRIANSILCDKAFLENIHCIIPSFDNEEFNSLSKKEDILCDDFGFNNIVISEYFNKLRELDYSELYGKYFRLGKGSNSNDFNAIKLMSSALIKILYPDAIYDKEDIREILEICIKSRKLIKKILNPNINLSYIDLESSEEIFL